MKKLIVAACILMVTGSGGALAEDGVPAEVPTMIQLSNRDINRVVCPGPMSDLIFSKEKGMTGHFSGNNAFVKFTIEDKNGKLIYAQEPSELYAVCNGSVYTIIATPTAIDAVTVRLAMPKSDSIDKNFARYRNMPVEKQALQIIREAYNGTYPSSYRVTEKREPLALCRDLDVALQEYVEVDGVGLRLKEYKVSAKNSADVDEKTFLSSKVSDSILAVAVEEHKLKSGQSTRVFVVEKKEHQPALAKTIETSPTEAGAE
jgi:conjugal transfer pilus assembly protein TraK